MTPVQCKRIGCSKPRRTGRSYRYCSNACQVLAAKEKILPEISCECGEMFIQTDRHLICRSCRYQAKKLPCIDCGKLRHPNNKSDRCLQCSNAVRPVKYGRTPKGNTINSDGYVMVAVPEWSSRNKRNGMAEHILVMEISIGRELYDHEEVHHMNGVRHDNRIENLELWSTSQPKGQRVEDKLVWAREIIETYGDYNNDRR